MCTRLAGAATMPDSNHQPSHHIMKMSAACMPSQWPELWYPCHVHGVNHDILHQGLLSQYFVCAYAALSPGVAASSAYP